MSDSHPTITLSIIPWQSKTRASEPELRPASEVHAQLEHGHGGAGLKQVIAAADDAMPPGGLPVASERAGGESRRTELKRKAGEITRSAAEDFALLTTRTSSMRYAADFLSTVGNVSFSKVMLKYKQNI